MVLWAFSEMYAFAMRWDGYAVCRMRVGQYFIMDEGGNLKEEKRWLIQGRFGMKLFMECSQVFISYVGLSNVNLYSISSWGLSSSNKTCDIIFRLAWSTKLKRTAYIFLKIDWKWLTDLIDFLTLSVWSSWSIFWSCCN